MAKTDRVCGTVICLTLGVLLDPARVVAAELDAESLTLDEVVVTARKREEKLQDVPISIVSVSAEELEKRGITDVASFTASVPGFAYNEERDRNTTKIGIRGVKAIEVNISRQKVSTFLDGKPQFGSQSATQMVDVERLEVYRGPQSAQFGRAVFAGALNYISTPVNLSELSGKLATTVGSENVASGSLLVTAPILREKLGFLVAVHADQADGPGSHVSTDGFRLGNQSTKYYSGKLTYKPTDWLSATLRHQYLSVLDGPSAQYAMDPNDPQIQLLDRSVATNTGVVDNRRSRVILGTIRFTPPATAWDRNFCLEAQPAPLNTTRNCILDPNVSLKRRRTTLDLDFDLGSRGSLSVSGFKSMDDTNRTDQASKSNLLPYRNTVLNSTINPYLMQRVKQDVDERFGQVLWVSPGNSRWRATAGYSYYAYEFAGKTYQNLDQPANQIQSEETVNQGLFGSLQYDITDRWTLSGEGRYQREAFTGVNDLANQRYTNTTHDFLPRYALTFKPSENLSFYAQVSKGINPAGVNIDVLTPIKQQIAAANGTLAQLNSFLTFDAETLWNYELGVKGTLFDRRLILEAAVYKLDWKDYSVAQTFIIAPNNPISAANIAAFGNVSGNYQSRVFYNSGDNKGDGLELSLEYLFNRHFTLSANYAHTNSQFVVGCSPDNVRYGLPVARTNPVSCVDVSGNRPTGIAADTANVAATITYNLFADWTWTNRLEGNFTGRMPTDESNLTWLPARTVGNLRSSLRRGPLTVTAFVTNITNNLQQTNVPQYASNPYYQKANLALSGDATTLPLGAAVMPRRAGLTVNYTF